MVNSTQQVKLFFFIALKETHLSLPDSQSTAFFQSAEFSCFSPIHPSNYLHKAIISLVYIMAADCGDHPVLSRRRSPNITGSRK
jgi:hypothetical protein